MSECTHDCSSCGESCADRQGGSPFQIKPLHEGCHVRKVYGVVSGKGGVGKSMVTSQLAVTMQRRGHRTAILDADVTGPSIPKCFGIHGRAVGSEDAILPVQTETGIQLMSVNLLLEHETDPVIWRGPVIGGVVQQFWGDVLWQDVDYMFVDMPPGTGDVALNVFQTLPVDGVIIVTSPQDLVGTVLLRHSRMLGAHCREPARSSEPQRRRLDATRYPRLSTARRHGAAVPVRSSTHRCAARRPIARICRSTRSRLGLRRVTRRICAGGASRKKPRVPFGIPRQ